MGVRETETSLIVWEAAPATEESSTRAAVQPAAAPLQHFSSLFGADAFYDAGSQGCGEGPLDKIAALVRKLAPEQTLEVRATDPSVLVDLPAWCRMTGNPLIRQAEDRYLIQKAQPPTA